MLPVHEPDQATRVIRFGVFEVDLHTTELRKQGVRIRLPLQSFQVLEALLRQPGELVTRKELKEKLWPADSFGDFEHGLNAAVNRVREALGDSSDNPRFVETLPRRGYRFVSTVEVLKPPSEPAREKESAPGLEITNTYPGGGLATNPANMPGEVPSRGFPLGFGAAISLVAVVLLIAAVALFIRKSSSSSKEPKIRSLAVLPFDNLSGDPSQDYFADGMTDELTTMLAKNSTLRIVSRTSVMQYKGVHRPLPEIAQKLGVDGVLEGSVNRSHDKVHMTIQLIQASSDMHVWAESYDRDAEAAGSLPREAAQTIARQLSHSVSQGPPPRFVSPEAHDAYLRGRYLWYKSKVAESGKYFKKATELQPDYALGWSGLSMYYSGGAMKGELKPEESLAPAYASAMKAVALDDSLPEAHLVLGGTLLIDRWDWEGAEREVNRAIELDPNFAEAYHLRAKILAVLNRQREAIESQKQATALDPFSKPDAMPMAFREARQYDAGIDDVRQRLEGDPQNAVLYWYLYLFYRSKGMKTVSAEMMEKAFLLNGDQATAASVHRAFQHGGYKALIRWQLNDLNRQSSTHYVSPMDKAELTAQLDDREQTIALIEEAYRHRAPDLLRIQNEPAFDFLHSDERYRTIIKGIGLPPAY